MIRFEQVSISYDAESMPVLRNVDLTIGAGELVLVVGRTGSGKSTLLQAINGLVPHFTGGTLTGRVSVNGRDTRTNPPRELADLVGVVAQDPLRSFVADNVEDELAYGMECQGIAPDVMRVRIEEILDLLGLAELRDRPLRTLSGGQAQRVAIGAALTSHPAVLVLDEPTSALDPGAAEDVLAALQRLVHDLGITVVLAEHRLERVVQYADRIISLPGDGMVSIGLPAAIMRDAVIVPPVVELGRLASWDPLPLSVRDARRMAPPLLDQLAGLVPAPAITLPAITMPAIPMPGENVTDHEAALVLHGVSAAYGSRQVLRRVSLSVRAGEIVALMGRNGAGKSTLLSTAVGLRTPTAGTVRANGLDPSTLRGPDLVRTVGLVPQQPSDLLEAATVGAECAASDHDARVPAGTTRALLDELAPGIDDTSRIDDATHPADLSEGQRLLLALAIVLAGRPPLILLDEPTRGLDYPTKTRLGRALRALAGDGHAIVLATHDVELAADAATRVAVIADGEIVADGPTPQVVVGSPMYAPQIAKVLAPQPWLTVSSVKVALAGVST